MPKLVSKVLLLACLPLFGCAQIWAKPGGTPEELASTKAGCSKQAWAKLPSDLQRVEVSPERSTMPTTTCSTTFGIYSCTTTPGSWTPASYRYDDRNQLARDGAIRSCLIAGGWQPVRNKEEAGAVTNSFASGATRP